MDIWKSGIMDNFVKWLDGGEFTPYGYAYDIGRGTMSAINRYKRYHKPHKAGNIDERSNGNGSLMRIMPACPFLSGRKNHFFREEKTIS